MSTSAFLKDVLGIDGAKALEKAVERAPVLDSVLVPRTILAWLNTAVRLGYEGEVPGLNNSYIKLTKYEELLDGLITIGETTYPFEHSSVTHVAAAIGVALGANLKPIDDDLKGNELSLLGKSIDLLVKARICSEELLKEESVCEECGGDNTTKNNDGHWYCKECAGKDPVEKFDQIHGQAHAPTEPKGPEPLMKQPQQPHPLNKELKLTKKESERVCSDCGGTQFKGNILMGCMCLRDLVKSSKPVVTVKADTFIVKFNKPLDSEAMSVVLKALKG